MAYPMSSSPISPVNLPKPYDISVAVHQALKLEVDVYDPEPIEVTCNTTDNSIAEQEDTDEVNDSLSSGDVDELLPNVMDSSDFIDEVWENVTLPDESEAWGENTSANIEELERFCRYIDGDDDIDEDIEDSFSSPEKKKDIIKYSRNMGMPRGGSSSAIAAGSSSSTSSALATGNAHHLQYVQTELANSDLWEEFDRIGTEMVITKNGRRMFPPLNLQVYGMNPEAIYSVYLDILPADDRRYKFMQTEWVPIGRIDKKFNFREYVHPDSPNSGQYWMEKPILFKFLKLTNNKITPHKDQIILNSMQKYQPSLRIKFHSQMGNGQETRSFSFPETTFIAVTAYQNSKITQLKIDNNPYARAFRDSAASDTSECDREQHQRKGSKRQTRSASTTPSPPIRNRPTAKIHAVKSEGSATSVESGFESGSSSSEITTSVNPCSITRSRQQQYLPPPPPLLPDPPCLYPFSYWADENSLYNSALIYPPPLLDSTMSFSEPFLHQSSQALLEAQIPNISPIKPLHPDSLYPHGPLMLFQEAALEEYEDTVFTS